jgi:hypothetical protein
MCGAGWAILLVGGKAAAPQGIPHQQWSGECFICPAYWPYAHQDAFILFVLQASWLPS